MKPFIEAVWGFICRVFEGLCRMFYEPLQEPSGKFSYTRITGAIAFATAIFIVVYGVFDGEESPHYIWTITALLAFSGGTKVVQKFAEMKPG